MNAIVKFVNTVRRYAAEVDGRCNLGVLRGTRNGNNDNVLIARPEDRMAISKIAILMVLALAASAQIVQADPVYKWVDEDGKVHFGDKPSTGHDSSQVKVSTAYKPERKATLDTSANGQSDEAPLRARSCNQATKNYEILSQPNLEVKRRNEYGEERSLSAEEQQRVMEKQKEAMDRFCLPT